MTNGVAGRSKSIPATRMLVLALGAAALGAAAIGALAIGRLAIGRFVVKKARLGVLEVDELTVRKFCVIDHQGPKP